MNAYAISFCSMTLRNYLIRPFIFVYLLKRDLNIHYEWSFILCLHTETFYSLHMLKWNVIMNPVIWKKKQHKNDVSLRLVFINVRMCTRILLSPGIKLRWNDCHFISSLIHPRWWSHWKFCKHCPVIAFDLDQFTSHFKDLKLP